MISHLQVAKIPLSMLVATSALFGFLLQESALSIELFFCTAGVFFLSTGAASLNNLQDADYDSHFSRTRNRPIPQGSLSQHAVLLQVMILFAIGTFLLYRAANNLIPALLGMATVLLYNGAYTPLKKRSVWAIVPGAACGMLPPYIGWLGAGGVFSSPVIILCMVLIGIWQVPHYWLILIKQRQEFIVEGRYYSIVSRYSRGQLKKITLVWVFSFACLSLVWPLVGVADRFPVTRYLLLLNACLLCFSCLKILSGNVDPSLKKLFLHLNISLALVMIIVGIDLVA